MEAALILPCHQYLPSEPSLAVGAQCLVQSSCQVHVSDVLISWHSCPRSSYTREMGSLHHGMAQPEIRQMESFLLIGGSSHLKNPTARTGSPSRAAQPSACRHWVSRLTGCLLPSTILLPIAHTYLCDEVTNVGQNPSCCKVDLPVCRLDELLIQTQVLSSTLPSNTQLIQVASTGKQAEVGNCLMRTSIPDLRTVWKHEEQPLPHARFPSLPPSPPALLKYCTCKTLIL